MKADELYEKERTIKAAMLRLHAAISQQRQFAIILTVTQYSPSTVGRLSAYQNSSQKVTATIWQSSQTRNEPKLLQPH